MTVLQMLQDRSNNQCELCTSKENLSQYTIPPSLNENVANDILVCKNCLDQIEGNTEMDVNHWRCLNDSMWSEHVAVQIMVWRMLKRLRNEGWPKDLLDMMYLDDEALALARATGEHEEELAKIIHRDVNGVILWFQVCLAVIMYLILTFLQLKNIYDRNCHHNHPYLLVFDSELYLWF